MIGHNVRIGAHTVIAACTGISRQHRDRQALHDRRPLRLSPATSSIADDVVITGYSMISRSIEQAGYTPAAYRLEEATRGAAGGAFQTPRSAGGARAQS